MRYSRSGRACGIALVLALVGPLGVSTGRAQPATGGEGTIYFRQIERDDSKLFSEGDDSELFTIAPGGGEPEQFTQNDVQDLAFSWSPDATRLAVVREDDVYVLDRSGNDLYALGVQPDEGTFNQPLAWSPDGSRIAFVRLVNERPRLFVVSSSGEGEARMVPGVTGAFPVWTVNGKRLIFSRHCYRHCPRWATEGDLGMHSISVGGRRLRKVPGTIQLDYAQDMTADGDLLFFRQTGGYRADHEWEIFMLRRGAPRPREIVTSRSDDLAYFSARWSPSGRSVVVAGDETHGAPESWMLTIRRNGTDEKTILECPDRLYDGCPRMVDWTAHDA